MKHSTIAIAASAVLVGSTISGWATTEDPYQELNTNWERFGAVYLRILENYYTDFEYGQIMQAAIEGMLEELDAYSQFYDAEGLRQLRQDTSGKFAGLGITVAVKGLYPVVIAPMENTPASRAGIQPGDRIVAIESKDTAGMSLEEVVEELRGDPGTKVHITVGRKGRTTDQVLEIERQIIEIKSVALAEAVQPNIGYISLRQTRFSENTTAEMEEGLEALVDKGVTSLILDLRGNPGGLLSQATQVADLFLPEGAPIVSIKEREGRREETRYSQRPPLVDAEMPLVVLIDKGSASAAEIVAGAIQDNDRGVLVGVPSFGKGSVQTIYELDPSDETALKLTTALYYTPSGRSIHRTDSGYGRRGAPRIRWQELELPSNLVLDLIANARSREEATAKIKTHLDLDEKQADLLLKTSLEELVSTSTKSKAQGTEEGAETIEDFKTSAGRKVFGGGGIKPDIAVPIDHKPTYVQQLERGRAFLEFVSTYMGRDSSMAHLEELPPVDREMVEEFAGFIQHSEEYSTYSSQGKKSLAGLRLASKELALGPQAEALIDSLTRQIDRAQVNSAVKAQYEPHIKAALAKEFALYLKGKKASILVGLESDKQVQTAIELLNDKKRYRSVLKTGAS